MIHTNITTLHITTLETIIIKTQANKLNFIDTICLKWAEHFAQLSHNDDADRHFQVCILVRTARNNPKGHLIELIPYQTKC